MTKTDVCNMALDAIGYPPISNIAADSTELGLRLKRLYDVAAKLVLEAHPWQKAMEHIHLTYESSQKYNYKNDIWEYIYDLPSNCLKALELEFGLPRLVEGSYLYSNDQVYAHNEMAVSSVTGDTIVCSAAIASTVVEKGYLQAYKVTGDWETFYYASFAASTFSGVTPDPSAASYLLTAGDVLNAPTNGLVLEYIKDIREEISSVVVYEEHTAMAIAMYLAYLMAPANKKSSQGIVSLRSQAKDSLDDAIYLDGGENKGQEGGVKLWIDVK